MTEINIRESIQETNKLNELEEVSNVPLLTIRTVFPFKLFPCVLTLDRQKLTVTDHFFFGSKQVENFLVADLVSVTSTQHFLFANLTFISGMRMNKKTSISYLWSEEARRFRRLIEGLLIASRQGIDVTKIEDNDLIAKLEELGSTQAAS